MKLSIVDPSPRKKEGCHNVTMELIANKFVLFVCLFVALRPKSTAMVSSPNHTFFPGQA